ncbi:MAG: transcriptional repressor [Actinomycetota bacterium]|nr:transcriptional repressor [Actinomycetota bacterium]
MATAVSDWAQHARAELRRTGHRAGAARLAVVDLLARQDCCLSAREIADELRAEGTEVGIASVYRALEVLDELRLVQRLDAGEGVVRYEPAHPSGRHHHHVVCDRCGRVSAFADPQLEQAIERTARRLDHAVEGHDVVLRGRCPRCR